MLNMKILKSMKFYKKLLIIVVGIYILGIFINQQKTLDSYKNNQEYYAKQIKEQTEYKESLLAKKDNLNSPEYVEEIARENNCELIYFTSESDNVGAHAFYKRLVYDMNAEKTFMKELLQNYQIHIV